MVRPLMTDTVFLAQKAQPADAGDVAVADDLLDTLKAHEDGCVGMAANMIGVNKAIIVFDNDGTPPLKCSTRSSSTARGCTWLRKAACPCKGSARPSATAPSKCSGRTAPCRPT